MGCLHGIAKFEAGRRENFKRSSTKFSPGNDIPIVNIGDEDVKTSRDCGELNTAKDCREVFDPDTDQDTNHEVSREIEESCA